MGMLCWRAALTAKDPYMSPDFTVVDSVLRLPAIFCQDGARFPIEGQYNSRLEQYVYYSYRIFAFIKFLSSRDSIESSSGLSRGVTLS
uniref:Secreted protein n=1 Tax=Steinernema glaseri TaxID=37863 RepID=A0A1I8A8T7_9BILA